MKVISAADYLARRAGGTKSEDGGSGSRHSNEAADKDSTASFTSTLYKVVASAERLQLQMLHAAASKQSDSEKALDLARVESLRAHIIGLRKAQQDCAHMQQLAEEKARRLSTKVEELEQEKIETSQELSRLRWAVMRGHIGKLKDTVTMGFLGAIQDGSDLRANAEKQKIATSIQSYQRQVDDAVHLADELALKLKQERSSHQTNHAVAESARLRLTRLEGELERAKRENLRLSMALAQQKAQARAADAMKAKSAREAAAAGKGAMAPPPGGWISGDGVVLDANGMPVLGADGRPLISSSGVQQGSGRTAAATAAAGVAGGTVSPEGLILDMHGRPIEGHNGQPVQHLAHRNAPAGGSVSADGVILDAAGRPVMGTDGQPLRHASSGVPPGGSVSADGVILDAAGRPVMGTDGQPLRHASSGVPPGSSAPLDLSHTDSSTTQRRASIQAGHTSTSSVTAKPRVPPEGTITPDGRVLDQYGSPAVGAVSNGGIMAGNVPRRKNWVRHSDIVAAGRMLTLSNIRVRDVPDMDLRGGKKNIGDPYLIFSLVRDDDAVVDDTRTPHVNNVRHARWNDTLRLFWPDDQTESSDTEPMRLKITLMDKNNKKKDALIGDITLPIDVGAGDIKVEVPSRCVSPLRPFVYFHFESTPEMYFETVEWTRVTDLIESANQNVNHTEDGSDEESVQL